MSALIIPFDVDAEKQKAVASVGGNLATMRVALESLQVSGVVDDESYQRCIDLRNEAAETEARAMKWWESLCSAGNALHKMLTKARGEQVAPFTAIKDSTSRLAENFLREQKRAKEQAEATLAQVVADRRESMESRADELMITGRLAEAEALRRQSSMTVAPTLPSAIPESAARVGEKWEPEVTDLLLLMVSMIPTDLLESELRQRTKALAQGRVPLMHAYRGVARPLVAVDMPVLRDCAARLGKAMNYPGVEVKDGFRIARKS